MARRKFGRFFSFLMLAVLGLALYGGYTLYNKNERTVKKVERSVQAAKSAW